MWFDYFSRAFTDQFPVFMIGITISGMVGVIQFVRIVVGHQTVTSKTTILGAGLFALLTGLLVFPVEVIHMIQAIKLAGETSSSIVLGGLYITFVPLLYGLFWFFVLCVGWLYWRRKVIASKAPNG